jgi:hypothetical protein
MRTCGCLLCNGLISAAKLQEKSISEQERRGQRYVDDPDVVAPSVITLNAVAVAHATDDFLFYMTGLRDPHAPGSYMRFHPRSRQAWCDEPRKVPTCSECGQGSRSRLARGDARRLPVMERRIAERTETSGQIVRVSAPQALPSICGTAAGGKSRSRWRIMNRRGQLAFTTGAMTMCRLIRWRRSKFDRAAATPFRKTGRFFLNQANRRNPEGLPRGASCRTTNRCSCCFHDRSPLKPSSA